MARAAPARPRATHLARAEESGVQCRRRGGTARPLLVINLPRPRPRLARLSRLRPRRRLAPKRASRVELAHPSGAPPPVGLPYLGWLRQSWVCSSCHQEARRRRRWRAAAHLEGWANWSRIPDRVAPNLG